MSQLDKEAGVRERLRQIIRQVRHEAASVGAGVIDLRELSAPEPMEQALLHVSRLGAGENVILWTPRVPRPLLQRLRERGVSFVFESAPDGSALVYVERS